MTDDGAAKLKKISEANIGRKLAILLDGRVLIAPRIKTAIGKSLIVTIGLAGEERASSEMLGRMHAAVFTLPETLEKK